VTPTISQDVIDKLGLTSEMVAEFNASAISGDVVMKAGIFVIRDAKAAAKLLGRTAEQWEGHLPVWVKPYRIPFQRDPVRYRGKPAKPFEWTDKKTGKTTVQKYVEPKGSTVVPYFGAINADGIEDVAIPLFLTEGGKKALCAGSHGLACIAFSGVHQWHAKGQRTLHPTFSTWVKLKGREVFIAFDADAISNNNVRQQEIELGRVLEAAGAIVRIIRFPERAPKLDDFLATHELTEFWQLVDDARKRGQLPPMELIAVDQPQRGRELTDLGNAERLVMKHGEKLRYCEAHKRWYVWTGTHWSPDETGEVHRLAEQTIRALYQEAAAVEDNDKRRALVDHARKSESHARLKAMVALASTQAEVAVRASDFDGDAWPLNCTNGVVNLRTGKLQPHDPKLLITKTTRTAFLADAKCPRWEAFVLECMGGDHELAGYLQRVAGYALTGDIREHCLFFLCGGGANGKGSFVNTLVRLLGDYAKPGALDLLLEKRGEAHPTEQADLFGARLVSVQEVEQGKPWAEATLKALTGGDPIKARRMREDFWTFEPTHKLLVSGNHKPRARGGDDGFWRRMRVIMFEVSFKGREDKTLGEKLAAEAPGILAWAVRGCLEWQRIGLAEPERVRTQTEAYRRESDSAGEFVDTRCVFERGSRIAKKKLRATYEEWCEDRGDAPLGAKRFMETLRRRAAQHDIELREVTVRDEGGFRDGWANLRFATEAEREERCGGVGVSGGHFEVPPKSIFHMRANCDLAPTNPHTPTIERAAGEPLAASGGGAEEGEWLF
jgi:P4 family phage/plasmid primase-like protien